MAANTLMRSSLQQPGKQLRATRDSHKGLAAVREAKENKPSKSKQTVKKQNHCLIVPATDRQWVQHWRSLKILHVFWVWAARKGLPRWHQEIWKCLLFCLMKLPYTVQNKRKMVLHGGRDGKKPWANVLVFICSLPAKPEKTAAQKRSSDKTTFWGALRSIRERKLSIISWRDE